MKKLYICHTVYHVYIMLLKEIKKNNVIDIILIDSIPKYDELKKKLLETKRFNNVQVIEEKNIDINIASNNLLKKLSKNKEIYKRVYNHINFNYNEYDEIYIFNDWTKVGYYLITGKIKYNLIEDGLDSLTIIDKQANIDKSIKGKILNFFDLNILPFGQSKYAKSIEVNSLKELKIPKNKVVELPRENLVEQLTEEDKKFIYNIFIDNIRTIDTLKKSPNINLILTQPLYKDNLVKSEKKQIEIYRYIASKFSNEDSVVIIKPHPRDNTIYNFKNVLSITKEIPIEIFNFNSDVKVENIITVTSCSINGVNFAKNKIRLGFEFLESI
ncbi:glycosyltransferase family 52 protein [Clostridium carnis]